MPSMLKRALYYLGLGPDEEYDENGVGYAPNPNPAPAPPAVEREPVSAVRTLAPAPPPAAASAPPTQVQPATPRVKPLVQPAGVVEVVAPRSFEDAQSVADHFKAKAPVIMNLQGADRDLSRRLIDFVSGLCYGLEGHMERVAQSVYLLTPSNVAVSDDEKRRLQERGLYEA